MRSTVGFVGQFLGTSLLGAMSIATLPSSPCDNLCKLPVAAVQLTSSVREQNNTTEDLFRRLNVRHRWQEDRLIRLSGVRIYKLENGKGKIVAEEAAGVEYRAPATETFSVSEQGGRTTYTRPRHEHCVPSCRLSPERATCRAPGCRLPSVWCKRT